MTFLAQMNNNRDTMFWNIKIYRVIIPTHEQRTIGPVTETRQRSAGNRGYIDLTAKITLTPPF